jgi:hypothetical protein
VISKGGEHPSPPLILIIITPTTTEHAIKTSRRASPSPPPWPTCQPYPSCRPTGALITPGCSGRAWWQLFSGLCSPCKLGPDGAPVLKLTVETYDSINVENNRRFSIPPDIRTATRRQRVAVSPVSRHEFNIRNLILISSQT